MVARKRRKYKGEDKRKEDSGAGTERRHGSAEYTSSPRMPVQHHKIDAYGRDNNGST